LDDSLRFPPISGEAELTLSPSSLETRPLVSPIVFCPSTRTVSPEKKFYDRRGGSPSPEYAVPNDGTPVIVEIADENNAPMSVNLRWCCELYKAVRKHFKCLSSEPDQILELDEKTVDSLRGLLIFNTEKPDDPSNICPTPWPAPLTNMVVQMFYLFLTRQTPQLKKVRLTFRLDVKEDRHLRYLSLFVHQLTEKKVSFEHLVFDKFLNLEKRGKEAVDEFADELSRLYGRKSTGQTSVLGLHSKDFEYLHSKGYLANIPVHTIIFPVQNLQLPRFLKFENLSPKSRYIYVEQRIPGRGPPKRGYYWTRDVKSGIFYIYERQNNAPH
jgi:hypothetical protein